VLLDEPIDLCLELFNIVESHRSLHHKISRLSLVLSRCLVKATGPGNCSFPSWGVRQICG
jgi:hypothetical protein